MKDRKILIIGMAGVLIVLIGILLALLLTPVTSFLFSDGTGDDFRSAGTCTARKAVEATEPPAPTMGDATIVVIPATPHTDATTAPQSVPTAYSQEKEPTSAPFVPATPAPTEEPNAYEKLYGMADTSMMQDIVNILLIGVDFSEERLTWNGKKEWHSDVMMVLSVNFDENRADLISLPRDTYAEIPGIKGIYKLNASLNCGGGLYASDGGVNPGGLEKVCEAAEWMLGGIPVDYYYAVTMTSLKSLVDAFGGLDYDLDLTYRIQGRSYTKGWQHMDGQAVLDYCRVRKAGNGLSSEDVGDANRVNRQKRILVAFFEHMKKQNLIVKIPDILDAFDGELFTNCTPAQTAALAAFAYGLNREDIGLYSMSGSTASLFQWNFCFTDQANRVDIIKKVYGVDAKQYHEYTLKYGRYRWASMLYDVYIKLLNPLTDYVQDLIDEDDKLPVNTSDPTPKPSDTPRPTDAPIVEPTSEPVTEPDDPKTPDPTPEPTPEPTDTPEPVQEYISFTVKVEWNDNDNREGVRPEQVPIKLIGNGTEIEKRAIEEDKKQKDKWETTFKNLPKSDTDGEIRYSIEMDKNERAYKDAKDFYRFEIKGSASKGFTVVCTYEAKAVGGEEDGTHASVGNRFLFEGTRKYSEAQRQQFEEYKQAVRDLKSCKSSADSEAKKAKKGKSNNLNSAAVAYLDQLEKTQKLAIALAETFGYNKVKNFTNEFLPKDVGWKTSSPWAVNYGLSGKVNEIRVDFN